MFYHLQNLFWGFCWGIYVQGVLLGGLCPGSFVQGFLSGVFCPVILYSMFIQHFGYLCFKLTTTIVLEHFRIGERANSVNFGNHVSYIFRLFHSHGSGDFVSGSNISS